jgi:hypothetical protein
VTGLSSLLERFNRWLAPAAASQAATTTTPQPTAVGADVVVTEIEEAEKAEETPEERER